MRFTDPNSFMGRWLALAATLAHRMRHRWSRRPSALVVPLIASALVGLTAANALWLQESRHPAPLWGRAVKTSPDPTSVGDGATATVLPGVRDAAREPSQLVRSIQKELAGRGHYNERVDGLMGQATRQAIIAFETAQGLKVTGRPSVALLATLGADDGVARPAEVAPTAEGVEVDVLRLQRLLNEEGFGPVAVDGRMGPQTERALAAFARSRGLAPDSPMELAVQALVGEGA